jgi:release factor glutamine methyltransferase
VRRVLEWTIGYLKEHGSESPRLDAEVLLAHARGCPRIQLYTEYDTVLPDAVRARMRELVKRRAEAEPVAYLVGHREFFSLEFEVTPDVLIPRPDTETLVVEALDAAKPRAAPRVLDLGTGSGCIAVAIAVNHPGALVTAIDRSGAALAVAGRNARRHGVAERVRFLEGDLFAPLPGDAQFDIIASNPPYVAADEMAGLQADVGRHEPHEALEGGVDGLDVIRRIVQGAGSVLAAGGHLLLECSPEQASTIRSLFEGSGRFDDVHVRSDLAGRPRVVHGRVA